MSLSSNLRPFLWRVGRKSVDYVLLPSLALNPRRFSKMWIELVAHWCLLLTLIPSLWFLSLLWRVDQRKWIPCFFPSFGSFMLQPLVYSYQARLKHFFGSYGDHRTAKNPRNVLVHLVHLGHGTQELGWAPKFSCVSLLSMPRLLPWRVVRRSRPPRFYSLPRSTLSWFASVIMAYGWRETRIAIFPPSHSFQFSSISITPGSKSHESWFMLKMS
jgi:hypothetical protein